VPALTPVTEVELALPLPVVAIEVDELIHTPPAVELLKPTDAPTHTLDGPVIGAGGAFTVNTVVAAQPVERV
jgi:hypothetical protein